MAKPVAKDRKISISFGRKPPASVRWGSFSHGAIPLVIGVTEDGAVCRVSFTRGASVNAVPTEWKKAWKSTKFIHDPKAVSPAVKAMAKADPMKLTMVGTPFQCAVWQNLLNIPRGEVITYAELARRSKNPKAVRAAGSACGANPVAILVPCHRVIASDGGLGGFGGGLSVKRRLLKEEGVEG